MKKTPLIKVEYCRNKKRTRVELGYFIELCETLRIKKRVCKNTLLVVGKN